MSAILSISKLEVNYGAIRAVRGIGLEVRQGEIVALLGPNGAGKSTTLRAVVGLNPVASGEIRVLGENVSNLPPDAIVRRGVTLTPEGRQVFADLTVEENLVLGGATKSRARRRELLDHMWADFPLLHERRRQLAGTMSGGQQQQLTIARSMMCEPKLLLLDEPSLGLAPQVVEGIFELLVKLRSQGTTILLVEQNVEQALEIVDRAYVLGRGEVTLSGSAAEVASAADLTKSYLGG